MVLREINRDMRDNLRRKEINGDEYGIECLINCQPESKISAADKMGRKKMEPYNEKNFLPLTLWNKSK